MTFISVIRNGMTAVDGVVADCTKKLYHFSPGTCYTTNNYMAGTRAQMQAVSARPGLWSLFNPANSNNTQYRPLIQPGTQHTQHTFSESLILNKLFSFFSLIHSLTHSAVQDKVFVLRQAFGSEFYHFMIECATRLYPWLDFILQVQYLLPPPPPLVDNYLNYSCKKGKGEGGGE